MPVTFFIVVLLDCFEIMLLNAKPNVNDAAITNINKDAFFICVNFSDFIFSDAVPNLDICKADLNAYENRIEDKYKKQIFIRLLEKENKDWQQLHYCLLYFLYEPCGSFTSNGSQI
ncbi:MAG TPA: hypothetical protein VLI68_15070 [Hanamia sp.]|nr:hypothetical protein [Hanamia sp.]